MPERRLGQCVTEFNLNVCNNNTNNYVEAAMRIMKDQILTGALDRLAEETIYKTIFANLVDDSYCTELIRSSSKTS